MNQVRGSYLAKAAAFVLLTAAGVVFIFSLIGLVALDELPEVRVLDNYFQSNVCERTLQSAANEAESMWRSYGDDESRFARSWYYSEVGWRGDIQCAVYSSDGKLLAQSLNASPIEQAGHIHTYTTEDLVVRTYVDRDLSYGLEGVNFDKLLFDYAKTYGDYFMPAAFASFFLAAGALLFLLAAIGHRRDTEEIVLRSMDRMPYDAFLLCAGIVCVLMFGCAAGASDIFNYEARSMSVLWLLALLVTYAAVMAAAGTTVVRIKAGGLFRNTLIWRWTGGLWSWGWRVLRRIWEWAVNAAAYVFDGASEWIGGMLHELPFVWKAVAAVCGVLLIELVLFLMAMGTWGFSGMLFLLFLIFNGCLLLFAWRLAADMMKLKRAGERLAAGELEQTVDTSRMLHEFKCHGEDLNSIAQGISRAVEKQLKSERLKTELITNVSHDIKTPLTSIVNYVDLLKKEGLTGKAEEYVAVLDRQSARLKKLTEDLVEASKASTGNIAVNLVCTDVGEIARQAAGEYTERLEKAKLELILNISEPSPQIMADGRLLWRVIDNLLSNVCKYAQEGTRVYLDIRRVSGCVSLAVKNISRDMLNIDPEELTERFVRGDMSRNTEGSGLGLNIARSLTELQNGSFTLSVDGDLFKAELQFNEIG